MKETARPTTGVMFAGKGRTILLLVAAAFMCVSPVMAGLTVPTWTPNPPGSVATPGQAAVGTQFNQSVNVSNTGTQTVTIGSATIVFVTQNAGEVSVTASTGNPTTITTGSTVTLNFTCALCSATAQGGVVANFTISGTEAVSNQAVSAARDLGNLTITPRETVISGTWYPSGSTHMGVTISAFDVSNPAVWGTQAGVDGAFSITLSGAKPGDSVRVEVTGIVPETTFTYTVATVTVPSGCTALDPVLLYDPTFTARDSTNTVLYAIGGRVRNNSGEYVGGLTMRMRIRHTNTDGSRVESADGAYAFRTDDFRQTFPGKFGVSGDTDPADGEPLILQLTSSDDVVFVMDKVSTDTGWTFDTDTDVVQPHLVLWDSIDTYYIPMSTVLTRSGNGAADLYLRDLPPTARFVFSKDQRYVGVGPIYLTATFKENVGGDLLGYSQNEPLPVTPTLRIDRPNSPGDLQACCYEMQRVDSINACTWSTVYNVLQGDGANLKDGQMTLTLTNGKDIGGNSQSAIIPTSFTILTVPPKATLTYSKSLGSSPPSVPLTGFTISATFDARIDPNSIVTITITPSSNDPPVNGNTLIDAAMVRVGDVGNGTLYSYAYTPTANLPGYYNVTLAGGRNLGVPATSINRTPSNPLFVLDTHRATPTLSYSRRGTGPSTGPTMVSSDGVAGQMLTVTATFDEPVSNPTIRINRPPLGTGQTFGDLLETPMVAVPPSATSTTLWGITYSVLGSNGSNLLDGTASVTVSNGINAIGNYSNSPGTSNRFDIDTLAPTLFSPTATAVTATPTRISATLPDFSNKLRIRAHFSEGMSSTFPPRLKVIRPGAAAAAVTTADMTPVSGLTDTFDYLYTVQAADPPGVIDGALEVSFLRAEDYAGNILKPITPTFNATVVTTAVPVVLTYSPNKPSYRAGDVVTLTATVGTNRAPLYALSGYAQPGLRFTGPGSGRDIPFLPLNLVAANSYTATYSVTASNETTLQDGPAWVSVLAQDDVGNLVTDSSVTNRSFQIVATPPVVEVTVEPSVGDDGVTPSVITTGTYTVTAHFLKSRTSPGDALMAITPTLWVTGPAPLPGPNDVTASMVRAGDSAHWTYTSTPVQSGRDGEYHLTIAASDSAGNVNEDPYTLFRIETQGPDVGLQFSQASGVLTTPAVAAAGPITVTAVFTKPIELATPPQVQIRSELTGLSGPNTVSPTGMTRVTSSVYTFQYTLSNGQDGPFLVDISGARDAFGNLNKPTRLPEKRLTVLTAAPTAYLTFSQDDRTNPAYFRAGLVKITATFSEPITPTAPTLQITGPQPIGPASMAGAVPATVWTYDYTITALPAIGLATADLTATGSAGGRVTSGTYNSQMALDTTSPAVALAYASSGSGTMIPAGSLTVTATFSPEGLGAGETPDVTLTRLAGGASPNNVSAQMHRVTSTVFVSSPAYAGTTLTITGPGGTTDGNFQVSLAGALDRARNTALTPSNNQVTIDTVRPAVTKLVYSKDVGSTIGSGPLSVTITFSEPISPSSPPTVRISRQLPGLPTVKAATSVVASTPTSIWRADFSIGAQDEGDWLLEISNARDFARNLSTYNPAQFATSRFAVDLTVMAVTMVYPPLGEPLTKYSTGASFVVTAIFNKPIVNTPRIAISGGTSSPINDVAASPMTATTNSAIWSFAYVGGLRQSDDGLFRVQILDAKERSGLTTNPEVGNATFAVDTVAPGIVSFSTSKPSPLSNGTLQFVIQYDETPVTLPTIRIVGVGNAPSTANDVNPAVDMTRDEGNPARFRFVTDVATGDDDFMAVTIARALDAAGNAAPNPTTNTYQIDTVPAVINLTYSLSSPVATGPLTITATAQGEPLTGTPLITVDNFREGTSINKVFRGAMTADPRDAKRYSYTFDVQSGNDSPPPFFVTLEDARDQAGNVSTVFNNQQFSVDGAPGVALSYSQAGTTFRTGPLAITATFNEAIISTPQLSVSAPGGTGTTNGVTA
ncbi:MAG: hypothetical protein HY814_09420, partial [Candidatus Riflebacteria bacterium]|nr:hypothetical protein [Candidatus Riflebacteria bacterium]